MSSCLIEDEFEGQARLNLEETLECTYKIFSIVLDAPCASTFSCTEVILTIMQTSIDPKVLFKCIQMAAAICKSSSKHLANKSGFQPSNETL